MLDIDCEDCGRVLIGYRQIVSLTDRPEGLRVAYVCWCGRPGAFLTGRRARRRHLSAVPPSPGPAPRPRPRAPRAAA
ncbi:MAG: hypothetical protein AB7V42_06710 [Thermoleophilia bacterium]